MINLLGPEAKNNIRAARRNVQLRLFAFMAAFVTFGIFSIYGVGFYLVMQDKAVAQQQLEQDREAVSAYSGVLTQAKEYKTNLTIAKKVLSTGMSYSSFLAATAKALPAGSVITQLTLTGPNGSASGAGVSASNTIVLRARTTSYGSALQIKESLEASDIFENVSLTDITKEEIVTESTAIDRKYPFSLSVSAAISTPKTVPAS